MANRKSPGSDGIPAEFYKKFWPKIGPTLLTAANFSLNEANELPNTQRRAYVTLVHKKGDRDDLSNWRPISLLNVDYKIITKTLATRLRLVVGEIISPDQTACIPGRTIEDNLFTLRDAIQYSHTHKEGFMCLSVDQEKAFDRVDHTFLQRVMEKFGFGLKFRKWIEVIYSNRTAHFLNNGYRTLAVLILRGLLQGCPLSMLLYIIYAEPLCCAIRADTSIKGVELPVPLKQGTSEHQKPTTHLLVSAYADDTSVYLKTGAGSAPSLDKIFKKLQDFEKATGAKFNATKTVACFFGTNPDSLYAGFPTRRYDLNWRDSSEEGIKILGITWYNDFKKTCETNYQNLYDKINLRLNHLSTRYLSIKGRALVLNTLALSKIWYTATVLPMPKAFSKKMEARMALFLWKDKGHYLSRFTLNKPLNQGGLSVKNCEIQASALTIKQTNTIITESRNPPWVSFARMWTQKHLHNLQPYTRFLSQYAQTSNPMHRFTNISTTPPSWYDNLCKMAKENSDLFKNKSELPTCKIMYTKILEKTLEHEQMGSVFDNKCCKKWDKHIPRHPIHWNRIWCTSFVGFNNKIQQDKLYKIRHHILTTGEDLNRPPKCMYCDHFKQLSVAETHMHLGVTCPFAKSVWEIYDPYVTALMGRPNTTTPHIDLFLGNFKNKNTLVITIISTVVHFLWKTRNDQKHENKVPNLEATDRQIKSSLRETVTLHYLKHKKNRTLDTFEEEFTTGHVLCALRDDKTLILNI